MSEKCPPACFKWLPEPLDKSQSFSVRTLASLFWQLYLVGIRPEHPPGSASQNTHLIVIRPFLSRLKANLLHNCTSLVIEKENLFQDFLPSTFQGLPGPPTNEASTQRCHNSRSGWDPVGMEVQSLPIVLVAFQSEFTRTSVELKLLTLSEKSGVFPAFLTGLLTRSLHLRPQPVISLATKPISRKLPQIYESPYRRLIITSSDSLYLFISDVNN